MKILKLFSLLIFIIAFPNKGFCQDLILKANYFTPQVVSFDYTGYITLTAIFQDIEPDEIFILIDNVKYNLTRQGSNTGYGPSGIVYQVSLNAQNLISKRTADDVYRVFVGYLDLYKGGLRINRYNEFIQIWDESLPLVEINKTPNGIFYSENIVNVVADINYDNSTSFSPVTKLVYEEFNDDYDFISFVLVPGFNANRSHWTIKNDITGIGKPISDNSQSYGSQGKLKGLTRFPLPTLFDQAEHGFSHETGHQWINYLSDTPFVTGVPHWPYCSIGTSIMGISIGGPGGEGGTFPYDLTINNNEYKFIPATETFLTGQYFKDIDLYLMGLISSNQVNDIDIFKYSGSPPSTNSIYTSSDFIHYTIQELIDVYGERNPSFGNSQKKFNILTIIVSPERLTNIEFSFYDFFSKRAEAKEKVPFHSGFAKGFANPFYLATQGLATLETKIFYSKKLSITPSNRDVGSVAGSTTFTITSSANWTLADDAGWLTVSPTSGSGNATISANYAANISTNSRVGTITLSESGLSSVAATVTQNGTGPVLSVTPPIISVASTSGSTGNFNITSNTGWSVIDDATWLNLSSSSGTGNGTLTVTTSSTNTSTNPRSANVTFSAAGVSSVIVNVMQSGIIGSPIVFNPNLNYGIVTDIEDNTYKTI